VVVVMMCVRICDGLTLFVCVSDVVHCVVCACRRVLYRVLLTSTYLDREMNL